MPTLDVTEVIDSSEFSDTFTVERRSAVVNANGRTEVTTSLIPDVNGVVYPTAPNNLLRQPDQQNAPQTIDVITTFRLRGPTDGGQPDIVSWAGDRYLVIGLQDYTRWGAGFVQASCSSIDSVDAVEP